MAVDAYRLPFDGQHVLTVVSRSSVSLNVVTGVAYQLTVLRLAVRRRAALSFLARPRLQTANRFRFRQFVVTFDAPSLEAVAFAFVPSSGVPAAEAVRFTWLHVARFVLEIANVRSVATITTGNIARCQASSAANRTLYCGFLGSRFGGNSSSSSSSGSNKASAGSVSTMCDR